MEMLPLSPNKKKELIKAARIYTKEPITMYHQRLNDEAGKIVLSDPSLITRPGGRGELLERARAAVHTSGYTYKKGKSRSKHNITEGSDVEEASARKHVKIDAEIRQQRIKVLNEDIEGLNKQITYKQKRIEQAELMKRYDQCDIISKEMQELKQERRTLQNELSTYRRKERKAQWYQQKKKAQRKGSKSKQVNSRPPRTNSSDESEVSATSPRSMSSDIHASQSRSASCDYVSTNDSLDKPGPSASEPEVLSDGEQNLSPGLLTSQN